MPKYPDWVTSQRPKGTAVKKVGNNFYLYQHTSKRVPGKKYPQSVDKYIGIITKDGILYSDVRKASLSDAEVYEFGFSRTLESIVNDEWKKPLKDDWHDVLLAIVHEHSPHSYLFMDHPVPEKVNRNIYIHAAKLERMIAPVTFEDLEIMKQIYLIHFKDRNIISAVHADQKELADRLSVKLEVN